MRLLTKEDRKNYQESQINYLLSKGWIKEEYKGLKIFTTNSLRGEKTVYELKVFRDLVSEAIIFKGYYAESMRTREIENAKLNFDGREEYKKNNPPRQTGAASCAITIREELKKEFPGIKFSVRSENFAGGDSVNIGWEDGPTVKQVEHFTGKYQEGNFNGMEDIYEYNNRRKDIPQAKYIMESRKISKESEAVLLPIVTEIFNNSPSGCHNPENLLYRIFCQTPIPSGAKVTGLSRTEITCGLTEEFYKIDFVLPENPVLNNPPISSGKVEIIKYSDKAIAVIGDTKPIKEVLKGLGGRFNFHLTCGIGWVFPINKMDEVKNAIFG